MDFVNTHYDNLGRLLEQTRPFRGGDTLQWTVYEYDKLDRTTKVTSPDGSVVERFYNESSYPSAATQGVPGQTVRAKDPWGRERWARFDEQNRLAEVVEPDPNGNGAVATGGMKTSYSYNTLGNLTLVTQGDQTRSFKYDALSRLTHQKLAERDATLDDSGAFIATRDPNQPIYSGGVWSDVFTYDNRSNLTQRVDARGVKTIFNYNSDPLNRLQSVSYDESGVQANLLNDFPIPDAPSVTYNYMTTGDKNRLQNYQVSNGMGNESFTYDGEGRLFQSTQTFSGREGYPLVKNYVWDSLDRMKELSYPVQYGVTGVAKKVERRSLPTQSTTHRARWSLSISEALKKRHTPTIRRQDC
jgi:YD repeat-containing protein